MASKKISSLIGQDISVKGKVKSILVIMLVIILALFIEALIVYFTTKTTANETANVLLDQTISILHDNEQEENHLTTTLKSEYMSIAKTVAYCINKNPTLADDKDELLNLASIVGVEEIHIFNDEGVIIKGTHEQFYGLNFDSGAQLSYFKRMLESKSAVMCQDVTPNTAEGKNMMYAMCWDETGTFMVQVGLTPTRLLQELENNEISAVLDGIPSYKGMDIFVLSLDDETVIGSTNSNLMGQKLDFDVSKDSSTKFDNIVVVEEENVFYVYEQRPKGTVLVAYSLSSDLENYIVSITVEAVYLIILGIILFLILQKLKRSNLIEKKRLEELALASQEREEQLNRITTLNTELQTARDNADKASMAKSAFLFNMSHDIRTPMNAIMGYTNLLEKNVGDKEKTTDYLQKIRSSSDFLLSLINNVLEMARIESGKANLDEEAVEIKKVVDEISDVYSELMINKKIEFKQNLDVNTKFLFCDKVKINEVYLNLLSNAYKYTLEGGKITMDIKELPSDKEGYTILKTTISDTGVGMSKDYLPKIFEEFTRETSYTDNKISGTGLGMPIVKKLVELMDGTITVDSEIGKGTTFVVTIPHRIAKDNQINQEKVIETTDIDLTGKRILLAEDNALNAEIATVLLNEVGLEVERAADGIICVDMLTKADVGYYDLILMDIQMPNMNGYEATKRIRALESKEKANIPIVAMTANAFDEDKKNAIDAGMNGHLAKPIDVPTLMDTLIKMLN